MRTHLLLLLATTLFQPVTGRAQEAPGETPGDLGWVLHGSDTLIVVRAAEGNAWLQQNLGSTEVAIDANDAAAYGDLYQWGRWTDGHQLRNSLTAPVTALDANDPSGLFAGSVLFYTGTDALHWWSGGNDLDVWQGTTATPTRGIDPCTALGTGWRLPTRTDWMDMMAAEGITGLASGLAGNLRLAPAGSRSGLTGTIINVGQFGNYWSTTTSGSYAKNLTIGDGFVNPDDDGYRGHGMSCRCLNKDLHAGIPTQASPEPALFPNPSDGTFTLRSNTPVLRLVVLDAAGRVLDTLRVNAMQATVALPRLPTGVYRLRLETADGIHHAPLVIVH